MEDYNLFLRLLAKGYQFANLPEILVYARIDHAVHGRRQGYKYIKSELQF